MKDNIKEKLLREAKEFINNKEINKAKAILKGYLEFDPKDPDFSSLLAKIYEQEEDYKSAYLILKDQDPNYFCVFEELVQIYIRLQKYDKLYNLWKKSKSRNFQDIKTGKEMENAAKYMQRTGIFLKSFVNKKIEVKGTLNYKEEQYLKYSYLKALEHIIKRHTSENNTPTKLTASIFFNHYDIEELLLAASRNIEFEKREFKLKYDFSDTYIFHFEKIGRDKYNTKTLNYFRVATIPNTNRIITMFPVFNRPSSSLCQITELDKLAICNEIVHTDRVHREKVYTLQ